MISRKDLRKLIEKLYPDVDYNKDTISNDYGVVYGLFKTVFDLTGIQVYPEIKKYTFFSWDHNFNDTCKKLEDGIIKCLTKSEENEAVLWYGFNGMNYMYDGVILAYKITVDEIYQEN